MIKTATGILPGDWPSRVESALRIFGADRALLLTEAVLLAKLVMVAAGYPFVLAGRGLRARLATAAEQSRAAPDPEVHRQPTGGPRESRGAAPNGRPPRALTTPPRSCR